MTVALYRGVILYEHSAPRLFDGSAVILMYSDID